jgi:hypothetical protein
VTSRLRTHIRPSVRAYASIWKASASCWPRSASRGWIGRLTCVGRRREIAGTWPTREGPGAASAAAPVVRTERRSWSSRRGRPPMPVDTKGARNCGRYLVEITPPVARTSDSHKATRAAARRGTPHPGTSGRQAEIPDTPCPPLPASSRRQALWRVQTPRAGCAFLAPWNRRGT